MANNKDASRLRCKAMHLIYPDNRGERFLQNTRNHPPNNTSSHPRIPWSEIFTFKITNNNELVKSKLNNGAV
jgi:hypothetical protein